MRAHRPSARPEDPVDVQRVASIMSAWELARDRAAGARPYTSSDTRSDTRSDSDRDEGGEGPCPICLDRLDPARPEISLFHGVRARTVDDSRVDDTIDDTIDDMPADTRASTARRLVARADDREGTRARTACGHAYHARCLGEFLGRASARNACPCCGARVCALEPTSPFPRSVNGDPTVFLTGADGAGRVRVWMVWDTTHDDGSASGREGGAPQSVREGGARAHATRRPFARNRTLEPPVCTHPSDWTAEERCRFGVQSCLSVSALLCAIGFMSCSR